MERHPSNLILASHRRQMAGSSLELSRGYTRGVLVRVRKGIYTEKSSWLGLRPWERYALTTAAVACANPPTVFCFVTAALIWGIPVTGVPDAIHIITRSPHKAGRTPATTQAALNSKTGTTGLENVRGYSLIRHYWSADVTQHLDFSVTSLMHTTLECISRLHLPEAVAIADHVLALRREEAQPLTRTQIERAAALLSSAAKRRRVLEVLALADGEAESAGESRSRALIHVLGLPAPELQHTFHDSQGFVARTDFFWPEFGVIGEFDGDCKYLDDALMGGKSAREIILAEKKREDRLRALGYTVVRWDWTAVTDPQLLRRKLAAAGLAAPRTGAKIPG